MERARERGGVWRGGVGKVKKENRAREWREQGGGGVERQRGSGKSEERERTESEGMERARENAHSTHTPQ